MKKLIIVFLLALASCSKNPAAQSTMTIRTDIEPIVKRLPKMVDKVAGVYWEAVKVSKDSFLSPPGKALYQLHGYVLLTKEAAEEFRRAYQWGPVAASWKPNLVVNAIGPVDGGWLTCTGFTNDAKAPLVGGYIYMLANRDVLFFDLQVE